MDLEANEMDVGRGRQRGATMVEFGLVSAVFFTLLLGIMEMGRLLHYWNAAAEATRLGARVAVVCDMNAPIIKTKMKGMLHLLSLADVNISYDPVGCSAANCKTVTVSVNPTVTIDLLIPFLSISLPLPPAATTLPRESMDSVNAAGEVNPVCT
jgi:hypothetical protein